MMKFKAFLSLSIFVLGMSAFAEDNGRAEIFENARSNAITIIETANQVNPSAQRERSIENLKNAKLLNDRFSIYLNCTNQPAAKRNVVLISKTGDIVACDNFYLASQDLQVWYLLTLGLVKDLNGLPDLAAKKGVEIYKDANHDLPESQE